jgi:hypothetical protein
MSYVAEASPRLRKVLIVTSSGGGGLLQAANAKEQQIKASYSHVEVIQRDVLRHWMWRWLGDFFASQWNRAQLRGDVWYQELMGNYGAPLMEYFFWPHIFICSLYTLFKYDVDRVIDTQVMGTSALIKAIRIFKRAKKKNVILEKVLVDLPTPKATHFFNSIKKLSDQDRSLFRLITIAPLLEPGETEAEFWAKHCNLTARELVYEGFYVRQAFRLYRKTREPRSSFSLVTHYKTREEFALIQAALRKASSSVKWNANSLAVSVAPNEHVFTILLGSQPSKEGTLGYVKQFLKLAQDPELPKTKTYLFVFCADHVSGTNSLMQRVSDFVAALQPYPSHFTIIPMSFQPDSVIAPLFHRSDITCTRSGGQTAMEIMSVGTGEAWIHSEAKKGIGPLTEEELLAGIPAWESANAVYLQRMIGAKIVTPETFVPEARRIMLGAHALSGAASR